ncbi:RNA-binding transcriptional accessory protein, partial [Myxococcota bacterium]|nr:RNA-binding transcriptional accessory protein [Myxococcota bacterium]
MSHPTISPENLKDLIPKMDLPKEIAAATGLPLKSISSTAELLADGATIPFIARYRKDVTGGLDEVDIGRIRDLIEELEEFEKRRLYMLTSIAQQEKLTGTILTLFLEAANKNEIEDLYLPYKRKRQTRAGKAREKGLEPLAELLLSDNPATFMERAADYINSERGVETVDEAVHGAMDIAAEVISEHPEVRDGCRKLFAKEGILSSKVISGKEETGITFRDYYEYSERVATMPSHRILAVSRGEKEEFLRVHIAIEEKRAIDLVEKFFPLRTQSLLSVWDELVKDCYKRLLEPSLEAEIRRDLKKQADLEAIKVFTLNLRELLLSPPMGQKWVLAVDPGFRSGCKLAVLNPQGDFISHKNIYPHPPRNHGDLARKVVSELVAQYKITAVAIGNGTAGRETEKFFTDMKKDRLLDPEVLIVRVDESGASIYSASPVAREEFPELDLTVRGSISIGRRLQDPLGELVKIDPKSIGVGQYQHDVDQTLLKNSLDEVVLNCVNQVGVEINNSSASLLKYVSGVGPQLAKAIVVYREQNGAFGERKELLKVPRLGPKAYEQCAGFLRIRGAKNLLDASGVHPENYSLVVGMAADLGVTVGDLVGNKELISSVNSKNYYSEKVGKFTMDDILAELMKPGRDPRKQFETVAFREDVMEFEDLEEGMVLEGVVTNVTGFGAFVDVGVHQDGLVHVSELSHTFVKD